jgi:hypothetical protein
MKKLMIAAAIVCAAALSQAAALSWYTWGYINDGAAETDYITGGQAYLVMVTDAASFAVADDLTITGGKIVDSAAFNAGETQGMWNTSELSGGSKYLFAIIGTNEGVAGTTPPSSGFFGVDANGGNETESGFYEAVWNSDTGATFASGESYAGMSISTAVVPEPTSGLLLLLGMAGLALRRKQA